MKKFLHFVLFVAALAFAACNNPNPNKPDGPSSNPLIGMWVVNTEEELLVWSYTVFGNNGVVTNYSLKSYGDAQYYDGNIEVLEGTQWEEKFEAKYTFDEQAQSIWISDIKGGTIEKINDDEFVLSNSYGYLETGTYRRAKGFKTIEHIATNGASNYYSHGREPEIDLDKGTVNGKKYNNETERCWMYTIKVTTNGTTTTSIDYLWGTELNVVAALEESMYIVARTGISRALYTYQDYPDKDEDACKQ